MAEEAGNDSAAARYLHLLAGVESPAHEHVGYRTCKEPVNGPKGETALCGRDCEPEPTSTDGLGGGGCCFVCPEHGVHSIVDPFADLR